MVHSVTLCSATLGEDGKREPPLGPLYIAAALEQIGVEVDFRDFQLEARAHGFSGEPLARYLRDHAAVVAISCFVDMLPAVIDATRRLYQAQPGTRFLLGGPGPTASARRILEEYPWVTGVVRGEGEETVQDWIQLLRTNGDRSVPGMVYRNGQQLVDGPERPRNRSLDDLPTPAYHLLDWTNYTHARVITTRGCSYRCSFCDVSALWGSKSVFRSLEATVAEMEVLRDRYGKSTISIVDDTFVLNRNRVRDFCRLLIQRRCSIQWGCFGRINLMTRELVELMAEAGCGAIFYGIDSGSQRVLDRTVKKVRALDVVPVLELSAQYFKKIEASFIWGYPFETLDDFQMTLDLAAQASMLAPKVNVQLHMLSPLPLSPIYRQFSGDLLEPEPEDRRWLLLPALLLDERASTVRDIVRSAPDIYPGFYTFPSLDKPTKRALLGRAMSALDRLVGTSLFDRRIAGLLEHDDPVLEQELLGGQTASTDRIGVGLALGFFNRVRHRTEFLAGQAPFEGTRGPEIVRQRSEPGRSA